MVGAWWNGHKTVVKNNDERGWRDDGGENRGGAGRGISRVGTSTTYHKEAASGFARAVAVVA